MQRPSGRSWRGSARPWHCNPDAAPADRPCHLLQPAPPPLRALISKPLLIDSLCGFVQQGIQLGKRPDLIGGGLIRSAGGWAVVKQLRRANAHQKGDERILGDGQYVQDVINQAAETLDRQYRLKAQGMDIEQVARRVAQIMDMSIKEVWSRGKYRRIVKVRSLLCYWAVRKLGISMASLSRRLHTSLAAVSQSVQRGENLAKENHYHLIQKT